MEPTTVLGHFLKWEAIEPGRVYLRQPFNGQYKTWTWAQAGDEARRMAAGLLSLNLPPKSHIAILSKNCAHWIMADLAILMAGHISIPIYPTLGADSILPVLEHSEARVIFIGKLDDFSTQEEGIPSALIRISFSAYGMESGYTWENWIREFQPIRQPHPWTKDEIFTIIYTSGTTGHPKGVMHSQGNVDTWIRAILSEIQVPEHPSLFSYLPLSHVAERWAIECTGIYVGAVLTFAETLDTFVKNLSDAQPFLFFGVPRIWEKFKSRIREKLPDKRLDFLLQLPLVSALIKKSIRKKLGFSKTAFFYSAAAPISEDTLVYFDKLGITVRQVYGMTEDSALSHLVPPGKNRIGSVGRKMLGVETKIAENGEIRVKSQALMKGYYKEPELTALMFDDEGYLKTGDKGEYDPEGYLFLTGRIKDQFKTDKGKYISPSAIEVKLLTHPDIELACVVGAGIPQPVALINLNEAAALKPRADLARSLAAFMETVNTSLDNFERLKKIIVTQPWTISNGLITPTLKVRRNELEKLHAPKYAQWYEEKETVLWE